MTQGEVETGRPVCPKCGARISRRVGCCGACLLEAALDTRFEEANSGLTDKASAPLRQYGDYELLQEIGRGGQAIVYRARQRSLNRIVALKIIALGAWASAPHLKRFRQEAETAAGLEHPNIVPIYEIGELDGCCYFTMKYVDGKAIDDFVREEAMPPRKAAELMIRLARAVEFAHEHGVLHRDLKPGNILVDREGDIHLTDFGLARLMEQESTVTQSFDVMGTPGYMSPEQASGQSRNLTRAADVYGLGAVFYHLLTGGPPFCGNNSYETVRQVIEAEPRDPRLTNPEIDADLATICLKCLEKNPARRYPSAGELAEDLEHWLHCEPVQARPAGLLVRSGKFLRRNRIAVSLGTATVAVAALILILGLVWMHQPDRSLRPGLAVLPFRNLGEANDIFFADGVQDDLLTKLAKIDDFKVISRNSVMSYRGLQNIREIARALNVSHVLEGSVRREGDRIRVNAQLVDAGTDRPVWTEEYERSLNDIFTVEGQIAEKVALQLHARLSTAERAALEKPATVDLTAFDFFTRARDLFLTAGTSNSGRQDMIEAASLLNQAIKRDPSFLEAYCQLAWVHGQLYVLGHDHTPQRLADSESAVQAAFRLKPDAGEAHIARAQILYRGHLDYQGALAELQQAATTVPNDPRIYELRGYVLRRMGKAEEGLRQLQHAAELDPRNVATLGQISLSYANLRRYPEAMAVCDRILAIDPNDANATAGRAYLPVAWKAELQAWHDAIASIRANNPAQVRRIADSWLTCALYERDVAAAKEALIAAGDNTPINLEAVHFNRSFAEAIIARLEKNEAKAHEAFLAARAEQEKIVAAQPDYAPSLCVLGLIDAGLGRKEDALREGRRAVELLPPEKDAINGPVLVEFLAMIAGWTGSNELAAEQLGRAVGYPGGPSYGELKLWPLWDPLRGDSRFEQIVASLAPR